MKLSIYTLTALLLTMAGSTQVAMSSSSTSSAIGQLQNKTKQIHALRKLGNNSILRREESEPAWSPIYLELADAYRADAEKTKEEKVRNIKFQQALKWYKKACDAHNEKTLWFARARLMECLLLGYDTREDFELVKKEIDALITQKDCSSAKQIANMRRGQMYYLGQGIPFTKFNRELGKQILQNEANSANRYTSKLAQAYLASRQTDDTNLEDIRDLWLSSLWQIEAKQLFQFISHRHQIAHDLEDFSPQCVRLLGKSMQLQSSQGPFFASELSEINKLSTELLAQNHVAAVRLDAYSWLIQHSIKNHDAKVLPNIFSKIMQEPLGIREEFAEIILNTFRPKVTLTENGQSYSYVEFPRNHKQVLENLLNSIQYEAAMPNTSMTDKVVALLKLCIWYAQNPALLFDDHREMSRTILNSLLNTQRLHVLDRELTIDEYRQLKHIVFELIREKVPHLSSRMQRANTITDVLELLRSYYERQINHRVTAESIQRDVFEAPNPDMHLLEQAENGDEDE